MLNAVLCDLPLGTVKKLKGDHSPEPAATQQQAKQRELVARHAGPPEEPNPLPAVEETFYTSWILVSNKFPHTT